MDKNEGINFICLLNSGFYVFLPQIPTTKNGLIEYQEHPFWMQKYCPSHKDDGTPSCSSSERMEVSTWFRSANLTNNFCRCLCKILFIYFESVAINLLGISIN
jgi:hypothetical protein